MDFERILTEIEKIPTPADNDAREVFWVVPQLLGVGADRRGSREVFIVGPRLEARTAIVRKRMEHGLWAGKAQMPFEASRVVLPPAAYFASMAALIAYELVRLGLGSAGIEPQNVFAAVEPIIELALRRGQLADESVMGLLGELLLLEQMLVAVGKRTELRSAVLDMWRGYQRSARDFSIGSSGIEVKTTSLQSSIHQIHSLAQVELQQTDTGGESALFLFSVGVIPAEMGALSIPVLADRLLSTLGEPGEAAGPADTAPLQARLLQLLIAYGNDSGSGYDHLSMRKVPAYAARFTTTFEPRLFNACDSDFKVLRSETLQGTFVSSDDISYKIILPEAPLNATNPISDWRSAVSDMVKDALSI